MTNGKLPLSRYVLLIIAGVAVGSGAFGVQITAETRDGQAASQYMLVDTIIKALLAGGGTTLGGAVVLQNRETHKQMVPTEELAAQTTQNSIRLEWMIDKLSELEKSSTETSKANADLLAKVEALTALNEAYKADLKSERLRFDAEKQVLKEKITELNARLDELLQHIEHLEGGKA